MRKSHGGRGAAALVLLGGLLSGLAAGITAAGTALADDRSWGVGWDDGVTVRRIVADVWEFSLAAGPDDYLSKSEVRDWSLATPELLRGLLEVPTDYRQEQGWVRLQAGRRVAHRESLALTGFVGLTYNWLDAQERALVLDDLVGDYDTWERDRFTERWILAVGLRPAWRPAGFLTVEFAFGLRFLWESWDETSERTFAGVEGADRSSASGHGRAFQDFGWEGASSLQVFLWF
jgi:hypothetical protein